MSLEFSEPKRINEARTPLQPQADGAPAPSEQALNKARDFALIQEVLSTDQEKS